MKGFICKETVERHQWGSKTRRFGNRKSWLGSQCHCPNITKLKFRALTLRTSEWALNFRSQWQRSHAPALYLLTGNRPTIFPWIHAWVCVQKKIDHRKRTQSSTSDLLHQWMGFHKTILLEKWMRIRKKDARVKASRGQITSSVSCSFLGFCTT